MYERPDVRDLRWLKLGCGEPKSAAAPASRGGMRLPIRPGERGVDEEGTASPAAKTPLLRSFIAAHPWGTETHPCWSGARSHFCTRGIDQPVGALIVNVASKS